MKSLEKITVRLTKKSQPIFNKINHIVEKNGAGNFTDTLLNMVLLGLESYEHGNRLINGHIVNLQETTKSKRTIMSVENESAEFSLAILVGLVLKLESYESEKNHPDENKIKFYKQCRIALWRIKDSFYKLSDIQIIEISNTICPIIKKMSKSAGMEESEKILFLMKDYFYKIIHETGAGFE